MIRTTQRSLFVVIAVTIAITGATCAFIFNSAFAKKTIDYFSFGAAAFLVIEGLYKIRRYRNDPYFPAQLMRHVRIIIGASVFSIHIMQCVYGV